MSIRWNRLGAMAALCILPVVAEMSHLSLARGATDRDGSWQAPPRAAKKANPVPSDDNSLAAGRTIYEANCLSCHGTRGRGDGPAAKDMDTAPSDLSHPLMWHQTDGELFWKISEGRSSMPSFDQQLAEKERWQVVNYMRTLAPKPRGTTSDQSKNGGSH
jgi:mono/diheme cytochrome c family protein